MAIIFTNDVDLSLWRRHTTVTRRLSFKAESAPVAALSTSLSTTTASLESASDGDVIVNEKKGQAQGQGAAAKDKPSARRKWGGGLWSSRGSSA